MKIHPCEQNTLEWLNLHLGIPTASGLDNLITPTGEIRKGEMPKTYLFKKVAESWRGRPLLDLNTFSTEQGMIIEEEARPFFELETNQKVRQVGFITTDDGKFGCSPDGLLCEDNGIEIKCPAAHTHVKYLVNGELPPEYAPQVHGSMFVTGFPKWTFLSYNRGFPPLILEIKRDETIIAAIAEALGEFHFKFEDAKSRLKSYENAK